MSVRVITFAIPLTRTERSRYRALGGFFEFARNFQGWLACFQFLIMQTGPLVHTYWLHLVHTWPLLMHTWPLLVGTWPLLVLTWPLRAGWVLFMQVYIID